MWSDEDRKRYDRSELRYPSDLTDAEWALVEPHIPPAKRGGRKREVNVRAVLQGILYVLETGCQWRHLPKDFPPRSTVWDYFDLWNYDGTLDRIHDALYVAMRRSAKCNRPPRSSTAGRRSRRKRGARTSGNGL